MQWVYRCPFCQAHLNPSGERVVLLADCELGRGLFLFDDEPGNYELTLPLDVEVQQGQVWEFLCPVCRKNLTSKADANIAMIRLTDEHQEDHAVFFSKIAGERCTFVVTAKGVQVFGPEAAMYEHLLWNKFF